MIRTLALMLLLASCAASPPVAEMKVVSPSQHRREVAHSRHCPKAAKGDSGDVQVRLDRIEDKLDLLDACLNDN